MQNLGLTLIVPCLLVHVLGGCGHCAEKVVAAAPVAASQRVPTNSVSHEVWSDLLGKYCNEQGLVNYRAWKASQEDMDKLRDYLNTLASAADPLECESAVRLAFWINAYNAVTVYGILQEYPIKSIRERTPKLWGYNIWKDLMLPVADKQYSLDEIEHQVLRRQSEARIHFAIVCASLGCPPLLNEAYTAKRLEEQLTLSAKRFLSNPTNFQIDPKAKSIRLSQIFEWFGEDFGATPQERLKAIWPYLSPEQQASLETSAWAERFNEYNWNLNEQ